MAENIQENTRLMNNTDHTERKYDEEKQVVPNARGNSQQEDPQPVREEDKTAVVQTDTVDTLSLHSGDSENSPGINTLKLSGSPRYSWWRRESKLFGYTIRTIWLYLVVAIILVFGIALGAGLGLRGHTGDEIIRGGGFVCIDLANGSRSFDCYILDTSNKVRLIHYVDGKWDNTSEEITLASDSVMPNSPLMALFYTYDNQEVWRLIFVNKDGYLQDVFKSTANPDWGPGVLISQARKFAVGAKGLSACVNKEYYGTAEDGIGIRLYYAAAEGGIWEMQYQHSNGDTWDVSYQFPNSTNGGCECVVRGTSITTVWLENNAGQLQEYWYDASNSSASPQHPNGKWVEGITWDGMKNGSSISSIQVNANQTTRYIHVEAQNGTIIELVAYGDAENTTITNELLVGDAMPETFLSTFVLNTTLGGADIHVFANGPKQQVEDNIREVQGETWSQQFLKITS